MQSHKFNPVLTALAIVALLLLGILPWAINVSFTPLRPDDLVSTVTVYAPTDAAYRTREALADITNTSVFEILPTEADTSPKLMITMTAPVTTQMTPTWKSVV